MFCFNPIVAREYALYGFKHIRFIETCFAAQNMVYLDTYLVRTWKECTFCFCTVFRKCQLGQVNWQCYISYVLLDFFFVVYWVKNLEISDYHQGFVYFSLQFYQFASCILLHYQAYKNSKLLCPPRKLTYSFWFSISMIHLILLSYF